MQNKTLGSYARERVSLAGLLGGKTIRSWHLHCLIMPSKTSHAELANKWINSTQEATSLKIVEQNPRGLAQAQAEQLGNIAHDP